MPTASRPTISALVHDLTKIARRGVGRSLAGQGTGADVPALSAIANNLDHDVPTDLPPRIAAVVVPAVKAIEPRYEREAIAEMLWIDLNQPDGFRAETPPPLEHRGNRYERAASRIGTTEGHFKNHLRRPLLVRVAQHIRATASGHRADGVEPTHFSSASDTVPPVNEALNEIAFASIHLHYGGLTSLLVAALDVHLPKAVGPWESVYNPGSWEVWERCSFKAYTAYNEWLIAVWFSLYTIPGLTNALADSTPRTVLQMKQLFKSSINCGPHLAELKANDLLKLRGQAADGPSYLDIWFPWYHSAFPAFQAGDFDPELLWEVPPPDEQAREEFHCITRNAYYLYQLCSEQVKLDGPYLALAREEALKDIQYYYRLPRDRPLVRDRYLDEEIRRTLEELEVSYR